MGTEGAFPETPTTRTSPFARLPPEIVKMIIACLAYDTPSLRACSLTCYSWYIVTVPHLHYKLYIGDFWGQKYQWPNPLHHMHALGLLPFVRTFWVRNDPFSQKQFNRRTINQFSTLTNVRRLMILSLDIPSFIPNIRRYFGHFLPSIRELSLREPKGSPRQIIYFIGLFQHLEDLELVCGRPYFQEEQADDLTLTPPFVPPLRGRLKLWSFRRVCLLKGMVDLLEGIRFRQMELFDVDGMPLLLDACANTLETLMLYPTDPRGEQLPPKGGRTFN